MEVPEIQPKTRRDLLFSFHIELNDVEEEWDAMGTEAAAGMVLSDTTSFVFTGSSDSFFPVGAAASSDRSRIATAPAEFPEVPISLCGVTDSESVPFDSCFAETRLKILNRLGSWIGRTRLIRTTDQSA